MQNPETTRASLNEFIRLIVAGETSLFEWLEIIHTPPDDGSYLNGYIRKIIEAGFHRQLSFELLYEVTMEAVRQTGHSYKTEKMQRQIAMSYAGMLAKAEENLERSNGNPLTAEECTRRFNEHFQRLEAQILASTSKSAEIKVVE